MARLAFGDESIERAGGLVRVHQIVGPVQQQKIDMVDAELLQRAVHPTDVSSLCGEVVVADAILGPKVRTNPA